MTDEEIAKRADAFLNKDNKEVDEYLDTALEGLKLTTKQAGTILGLIKVAYIVGAKENAPKWHYPSKGEYPEKEKKVYALVHKGLQVSDEFAFWQIETDSVCDMAMWVDCFGKRIDVECWQYLPEPPKEENNEH